MKIYWTNLFSLRLILVGALLLGLLGNFTLLANKKISYSFPSNQFSLFKENLYNKLEDQSSKTKFDFYSNSIPIPNKNNSSSNPFLVLSDTCVLFVGHFDSPYSIDMFDPATGTFLSTMATGNDEAKQNLYLDCDEVNCKVYGTTGKGIAHIDPITGFEKNAPLTTTLYRGVAYNSATNTNFVGHALNNTVIEFDLDGNTVNNPFVSYSASGFESIKEILWGSDGNLYVLASTEFSSDLTRINKYNSSGSSLGNIFNQTGIYAEYMTFGPNGNLFVSDAANGRILEVDPSSGSWSVFATLSSFIPQGLEFNPVDDILYVADRNSSPGRVVRLNGSTGAYISEFTHANFKYITDLTFKCNECIGVVNEDCYNGIDDDGNGIADMDCSCPGNEANAVSHINSGAANADNTLGAADLSYATIAVGDDIFLDFGATVPPGDTIQIHITRVTVGGTVTIQGYKHLSRILDNEIVWGDPANGLTTLAAIADVGDFEAINFIAPPGGDGIRYLQFTREAGQIGLDAIRYCGTLTPLEICDNDTDDDGDGDTDCEDSDCRDCYEPFDCNSTLYQSIKPSGAAYYNLYEVTPSPLSLDSLFNLTDNGMYTNDFNSIAFNPTNNFIYGIDPNTVNGHRLFKINALGEVDDLGLLNNVSGLNGQFLQAGGMAADGTYYLTGEDEGLYSVDVETNSVTFIANLGFATHDIAVNPIDGQIYCWNNDETRLVQINPSNGATTNIGSPATKWETFGAFYFNEQGEIIAYGRDNTQSLTKQKTLAKIDPATGVVTSLGNATETQDNDGCSCANGIAMTKAGPTSSVDAGDSYTYTFTIINQTGSALSNVTFNDVLTNGFLWDSEPQNVTGLTIGATSITGTATANFTISNIPVGSANSFTIDVQTVAGTCIDYPNQASLTNIPSTFGASVLSDDPNTADIGDSTVVNVTNCTVNCEPGTVSGDESNCGAYNPDLISTVVLASGAPSDSFEYKWQISLDNSNWTDVSNATYIEYNPTPIMQTTYFRRAARSISCTDWIFSNAVTKAVENNITDAGEIADHEIQTGSFDPAQIISVSPASGGLGPVEYRWQSSLGSNSWSVIPGETGESYDPPTITQTMYYRRQAKSQSCTATPANCCGEKSIWENSNVVVKMVK